MFLGVKETFISAWLAQNRPYVDFTYNPDYNVAMPIELAIKPGVDLSPSESLIGDLIAQLYEHNPTQGGIAELGLMAFVQSYAEWLKEHSGKIDLPAPEEAYKKLPEETRLLIERRMGGLKVVHTYQVTPSLVRGGSEFGPQKSPTFDLHITPLSRWMKGDMVVATLRLGYLYGEKIFSEGNIPSGFLEVDFQSEYFREMGMPVEVVYHNRQFIDAGRPIMAWTRWLGVVADRKGLAQGLELPLDLPASHNSLRDHDHMVYFGSGEGDNPNGLLTTGFEIDYRQHRDVLTTSCSPYSVIEGQMSVLPPWIPGANKRTTWEDLRASGYNFDNLVLSESPDERRGDLKLMLPIETVSSIKL